MPVPVEDEVRRGAIELGVSLDDSAMLRIWRFLDLLTLWNRRLRLTGDRDPGVLARKHVVDSLAVLPELQNPGMLIDVGSGGGFPGIVLGCVRPDLTLRLVESRRRPVSFLAEAIRTIPLPDAIALEMRAEDAAADASLGKRAAVVVSRALRLDVLLRLGAPLLAPGGVIVAMQTPSTARSPRARAQAGLELLRTRDYRLPGGEQRRLLVFTASS